MLAGSLNSIRSGYLPHAIVDGTSLESTTDGVENAGDENSPAATEIFVAW
jgi:hypothetical protein